MKNTLVMLKQLHPLRGHRGLCTTLALWIAISVLSGWSPTSWAGSLACTRNGIVVPPQGSLNVGDKLVCSNQTYGGGDRDTFIVRTAASCASVISKNVVALGTGQSDTVVEHQIQVTFIGYIPDDNARDLEVGKISYVYICRTTVDFRAAWPPPPISLVRTTVDPAGVGTAIVGSAGSVEGRAIVSVYNSRTRSTETQSAIDDGSFTLNSNAQVGDTLAITVTDRYLNASKLPNGNDFATELTVLNDPAQGGLFSSIKVWDVDVTPGVSSALPTCQLTDASNQTVDSCSVQPLTVEKQNSTVVGQVRTWFRVAYPTQNGRDIATGPLPVVMFVHGGFNGANNSSLSHQGYSYIMEELARHGFFTISINHHDSSLTDKSLSNLVVKYLELMQDWNDGTMVAPWVGIRDNLEFSVASGGTNRLLNVGLVGHSMGAQVVMGAMNDLGLSGNSAPAKVSAIAMIAPAPNSSGSLLSPKDAPYFLLLGARDGYCWALACYDYYDNAYLEKDRAMRTNKEYKMSAYVYGANHNFFNTKWQTEDDGLWVTNPFPGFSVLTSADQKKWQEDVAVRSFLAFFRWSMKLTTSYREFLSGQLRFGALSSESIFWTFQNPARLVVDDFEDHTINGKYASPDGQNRLNSTISISVQDEGCIITKTNQCRNNIRNYFQCQPLSECRISFDNYRNDLHHTRTEGILLDWTAPIVYKTAFPSQDVSTTYKFLTLRAAKVVDHVPLADEDDLNLRIRLCSGIGLGTACSEVNSNRYGTLRRPYTGVYTQLTGIRIPLEHFTLNRSGVNLAAVTSVEIHLDGKGILALDDIEFAQ